MPRDRRVAKVSYKPPQRVLIAPDKFKGTLTSEQAARAIEKGLHRAWPGVETTRLELTDGGEGFMEFLVRHTGGKIRTARTVDAAMRPCRAGWGVLGNGRTAVIGLNCASGLAQLPARLRNPETATNLGTARLIALAVRKGFREIVVGLGGSATTEGGISLGLALGYRFLDDAHRDIPPNGAGLARLARIVPPPALPKVRFVVATDVDIPLCGPNGAACRFAPQKGADVAMTARLEEGLRRLDRIVRRDLGEALAERPGAGAAGGCGYGMMAFFRARRENGFQLVRRLVKLDRLIREHDLVITGEGALDPTSLLGKAPVQLGRLARSLGRPGWAFCGRCTLPVGQSPFDRIAALDRPAEGLTPVQHARRLEGLVYETCREEGAGGGKIGLNVL